jgi:hypothetical protein
MDSPIEPDIQNKTTEQPSSDKQPSSIENTFTEVEKSFFDESKNLEPAQLNKPHAEEYFKQIPELTPDQQTRLITLYKKWRDNISGEYPEPFPKKKRMIADYN